MITKSPCFSAGISNFGTIIRWKKSLFFVGVLAALGFAPYNYIWAFAMSIGIMIIRLWFCQSWREGFSCGWWWGLGFYMSTLFWVGNSLLIDAAKFAWLLPISLFVFPGAFACYSATSAAVIVLLKRVYNTSFVLYGLTFVLIWSVAEFLQGHLFTGFPWNLTAYIWAKTLPMAQMVAFLGSYGFGLVTLLLFAVPGIFVLYRFSAVSLLRGFGVSCFFLAVFYGIGFYRLQHTQITFWPDVYLRLVHPSVPQKEKIDPQYALKHFNELRSLSNFASLQQITHVIWAEGALPWSFTPDLLNIFPSIGEGEKDFILLTGGTYKPNSSEVFNTMFMKKPGHNLVPIYSKNHLLPFGEYIPCRSFLSQFIPSHWLKKITPGFMDFSPGNKDHTTACPGLPLFRTLICYEAIFPAALKSSNKDARPLWILNITNDGWFGNSPGPYQHFVSAQFRAIEAGLPLVRIANCGISAIVDPLGRIIKSMPAHFCGVIDGKLPKAIPVTLYGYFHEWIWFALIMCGFTTLVISRFFNRFRPIN